MKATARNWKKKKEKKNRNIKNLFPLKVSILFILHFWCSAFVFLLFFFAFEILATMLVLLHAKWFELSVYLLHSTCLHSGELGWFTSTQIDFWIVSKLCNRKEICDKRNLFLFAVHTVFSFETRRECKVQCVTEDGVLLFGTMSLNLERSCNKIRLGHLNASFVIFRIPRSLKF